MLFFLCYEFPGQRLFRQAKRRSCANFARLWCDGFGVYRRVWESVVAEPFGAFLVRSGYVTKEQVEAGLSHQRRMRKMRIGEILVARGLLLAGELERILTERRTNNHQRPLGEHLVSCGAVQLTQLEQALEEQASRRQRKIGEVLVELGHLSEHALMEAVARR